MVLALEKESAVSNCRQRRDHHVEVFSIWLCTIAHRLCVVSMLFVVEIVRNVLARRVVLS